MLNEQTAVGELLRNWRQRRRLSQLALAMDADVSQRHLSFIESGRSAPSREMVVRLAERLLIPLRDRNALLAAAGFAPIYRERSSDDPALASARHAVSLILKGHEPYPALAIDRHWNMIEANRTASSLLAGVDSELLKAPINVLRLSLHPKGLARRIENFREWREHILSRLSAQVEQTADRVLTDLLAELKTYRVPPRRTAHKPDSLPKLGGVAVPLRLSTKRGVLSLISTTTVFGTALDVSLSELAIESFFPADDATAKLLMGCETDAART